MLRVSDSSCVTLCCDVVLVIADIGVPRVPDMPRDPVKCSVCGRFKHKDKGHKYAVSSKEYLCQACYNKRRFNNDVCTL
jgi:hypothetical protein